MTTFYFVRHAEPNYQNRNDRQQELTPKGLRDRKLVTEFLAARNIDAIFSSPYRRAVDTVRDFAERYGYEIELVEDFRERKVDSVWIEDFSAFSRRQWDDFTFRLTDGESLEAVQARNLRALRVLLERCPGKTIAVGSHGTALSTVIHAFQPAFSYEAFEQIRTLMPWIVRFDFDEGHRCAGISSYDLFTGEETVWLPDSCSAAE